MSFRTSVLVEEEVIFHVEDHVVINPNVFQIHLPNPGEAGNPGTPYLFLLSFRRESWGRVRIIKIGMVSLDSLIRPRYGVP
jgi:hypothetical protein